MTTREIQQIDSPFNDIKTVIDVPEAYRIDTKPYTERPFFAGEVVFPTSAARYTFLNTSIKFLPGDVIRSNASLLSAMKIASYYRSDLVLNISMAGTISHAGCILVGVLPPFPSYPTTGTPHPRLINTIMSGPHAFLNANEATSVTLPVPWYCNSDMATLDMDTSDPSATTLDITATNGNYATLVFFVLNPLAPSTGASTSLSIIVEACFKNLDMVVPTPRYVTWNPQSLTGRTPLSSTEELDKMMELVSSIAVDIASISAASATPPYHLLPRIVRLFWECMKCITKHDETDSSVMSPEAMDAWEPQFDFSGGMLSLLSRAGTGLLDATAGGIKRLANDAIDGGRMIVREWTGLHNPNDATISHRVITTARNFHNNIDMEQFFEKLDPFGNFNRITKEPLFGSTVNEMALTHIQSKKQYLGSFKVSTSDSVGTLLWVKPISPFQGGYKTDGSSNTIQVANNIELLHSFSRGWRGPLRLHIHSAMNNKQQVKLKVLKMYNPSLKCLSNFPKYSTISNAPSHLLEFTQGGQMHEVELPYLCRNDITPCAEDPSFEPLFHGLYYIYVAQPFANSESSPSTIEFNVFMSCDPGFQWYGYANKQTVHDDFNAVPAAVLRNLPDKIQIDKQHNVPLIFTSIGESMYVHNLESEEQREVPSSLAIKYGVPYYEFARLNPNLIRRYKENKDNWGVRDNKVEKINLPPYYAAKVTPQKVEKSINERNSKLVSIDRVRIANGFKSTNEDKEEKKVAFKLGNEALYPDLTSWEPQVGGIEVMNKPQDQHENMRIDEERSTIQHFTRLRPNQDIRPYVRRMYKAFSAEKEIEANNYLVTAVPLSSFFGENSQEWHYTPLETFSRMYYGKTAGLKMRVKLCSKKWDDSTVAANALEFRAYYVPPQYSFVQSSATVVGASINNNAFPNPADVNFLPDNAVPCQVTPVTQQVHQEEYEFELPDLSYYKFLGGPDKFRNFNTAVNVDALSTVDFGNILFGIYNTRGNQTCRFTMEIFVGANDAARFGYHSIAPVFIIYKGTNATYLGNNTGPSGVISATLNSYQYKGTWL